VVEEVITSACTNFHVIHDWSFQQPNQDFLDYFSKHYSKGELKGKDVKKIDGLVFHQDIILVPATLWVRILHLYHDVQTIGNPGVASTRGNSRELAGE
jgi:hypothetical protein